MDVQDLGRPVRQPERGKHTDPFPAELEEMKAKYEAVPSFHKTDHIEKEDLITLFDRYSKNVGENLYTMAEALGINTSTLYELLRRKDIKNLFAPYKERRQKLYSQEMMRAAMGPLTKIRNGEDPALFEIKASDLAAKYLAFMARLTDPELGANARDDGQIQVQVNTLVQVRDFSVDGDEKVIDVKPAEETDGGPGEL